MLPSPAMPRSIVLPGDAEVPTGTWLIRKVPRDLMARMKRVAASEHTSVNRLLLDLAFDYVHHYETGKAKRLTMRYLTPRESAEVRRVVASMQRSMRTKTKKQRKL